MNIEQWCNLDESIYIAITDEQYKQYAGLQYNIHTIKDLSKIRVSHAILFLKNFNGPKELFLSSLENYAESETKHIELRLHNYRNKKIINKQNRYHDDFVNWSNWRQFNNREQNSLKRKEVFDDFIQKTEIISPLIFDRFQRIRNIYKDVTTKSNSSLSELSPLDGYLINEKISHSNLIKFVTKLGKKSKNQFSKSLKEISKLVLNREAEYYDDFYFFRNKIYSPFNQKFAKIDPVKIIKKMFKGLGFNLSYINIDTIDRPNKYPSPICFFVKIPNEIRILYKPETPYFDLQGCFHESGHAMHASSISNSISYWEKYNLSMGIAEIFSIFLERLTKNKIFLKHILSEHIDNSFFEDLNLRNNFMELYFISFYTANSLMKYHFWKDRLSVEKSITLYHDLYKEYTGIDMPGQYWMLHHILPDAIMYVPSYLLAAVRAKELEVHIINKFSEKWWLNPDAGKYLRTLMSPGASIDLSIFSKLNSDLYIKDITC